MVMAVENIKLKRVSKTFGDSLALDDFSIEIFQGELLVLLGPSGCGKTTALNILAGLETPTSGEVLFGDRIVNNLPADKREISMVFQGVGLYPHLNVLQNISFALRLQKIPENIIRERVNDVVQILGITPLTNRRINELSGGERQRVAIAKALVRRPYLFLLDEPFSSLDADLRRELRSEIVRIHQQLGTTMVFVTHDQEEAMAVADRIVVMSKSKLQQVGSPLDVHDNPANLWVAKFIGAYPINVISCLFNREESLISLFEPHGPKLPVDLALRNLIHMGEVEGEFILGVRPQYVQIVGTDECKPKILGVVYTRQVLGTQILYTLKFEAHELRAVVSSEFRFEVGQSVYVHLDLDHAFCFELTSGRRVYSE